MALSEGPTDQPSSTTGQPAPPPPGPPGYFAGFQQPPPDPARSSRRGRIIGLVALLIIAIGVVGFVVLRDRVPNDVNSLAAGECFDRPQETTVTAVQRQPCDEAHDAETVLVLNYPADSGAAYPIVSGFGDYAAENCIPAFESYTGRIYANDVELEMGYFGPTLGSWGDGDRGIICYVYRVDAQKLTASVRAGVLPSP